MFRILWDPSSGNIKRASLKLLVMFYVRSRCLAAWNLDLWCVCLVRQVHSELLSVVWVPGATSWELLSVVCVSGATSWELLSVVCVSGATSWELLSVVCVPGATSWELLSVVCAWGDELRTTTVLRCQTPTTHTKISQVISVKHLQHSLRMDHEGSETCRSFLLYFKTLIQRRF